MWFPGVGHGGLHAQWQKVELTQSALRGLCIGTAFASAASAEERSAGVIVQSQLPAVQGSKLLMFLCIPS